MQNIYNNIEMSVIVPVYNEEQAIVQVINDLKNELKKLGLEHEIIVVNDCSTDNCSSILGSIEGIKLLRHRQNKGYGASLKTGAKYAKYDWLLFFDGDGQCKAENIQDFLQHASEYDVIIGARQGYKGPWWRQPGKKILQWVANYLAETSIPDLNCGFRLLKKEDFFKYRHLFPDGYSLSTTSTLAFFKEDFNVKYVPITVNKRLGKSSLKISDGFLTLMLIIRLTMLFAPLKIFLPVSLLGFIISAIWGILDLISSNLQMISKTSGFLFVASLLVFLFGLLADQVAAIRRELKR